MPVRASPSAETTGSTTPFSTAAAAAAINPAPAGGFQGRDGPAAATRASRRAAEAASSPSLRLSYTKLDRGTYPSGRSGATTVATAVAGVTRTCVVCAVPLVTRTTHAAWHSPQHFLRCSHRHVAGAAPATAAWISAEPALEHALPAHTSTSADSTTTEG